MAVDLSSSSSNPLAQQQATGSLSVAADSSASDSSTYLFEQQKLTSLTKWKQISKKLDEHNLRARPLKQSDHENGYLALLSQLTEVGQITREQFVERFNRMKRINQIDEHYVIVVIEDVKTSEIVAASTLLIELKFIHECALRGRLEDVAVLDSWRGKGVGQLIVQIIVELAKEVYKCYKLSLDCKDDLKKFYSLNSFTYGSNMLCIRF